MFAAEQALGLPSGSLAGLLGFGPPSKTPPSAPRQPGVVDAILADNGSCCSACIANCMPAGGDDNQLGVGSNPNSFAGVLSPGGVRRGGVDRVYGAPGVVAPVGGWRCCVLARRRQGRVVGAGMLAGFPLAAAWGVPRCRVVVTDVAAGLVVPGCCDWVGRWLG